MPQERRSNGEYALALEAQRNALKATRDALVAKFGNRVREYGAREHAVGHVKRVGYEAASVPMPWDWPVR